MIQWIKSMHDTYGDAVRVNPTEVSFISGETAWPDIYGFRTGKHKTEAYLKDRTWYARPVNGVWHLLASTEADHSRMRRNLSHAFGDKALREQEALVQGFVDLLVQRLHDQVEENVGAVDIMVPKPAMKWTCCYKACLRHVLGDKEAFLPLSYDPC